MADTMLQFSCVLISFTLCFSQNITITHFKRISPEHRSALNCSVACAEDSQCSGYMVGEQHICTLVTEGDVATVCIPSYACYGKVQVISPPPTINEPTEEPTTVEELTTTAIPQGCVESIRKAISGPPYITFHDSDSVLKFSDIASYISGANDIGQKSKASYYPDFPSDVTDAYIIQGSKNYVVVLDGKYIVSYVTLYTLCYLIKLNHSEASKIC